MEKHITKNGIEYDLRGEQGAGDEPYQGKRREDRSQRTHLQMKNFLANCKKGLEKRSADVYNMSASQVRIKGRVPVPCP